MPTMQCMQSIERDRDRQRKDTQRGREREKEGQAILLPLVFLHKRDIRWLQKPP